MDVFVIPIGRDRYELYCEHAAEPGEADDGPSSGFFGRLKHGFLVTLRAAEERSHRPVAEPPRGWLARVQERVLAWVAERVAEQRLLWNLRRQTEVVVVHPQDMAFDEVMALVRESLKRDYDRHRRWLVVDVIGLIGSGLVMPIPGPNLLAYYFAFRVVGHWLSMRGATQGLHHVSWSGRPCAPLGELRELAAMEPRVRDARLREIAARLRLPHLTAFFERIAIPHALAARRGACEEDLAGGRPAAARRTEESTLK